MSLNNRIKRKKEVREECIDQEGAIFRLPDETLLSIFKYFTTDELILAAGHCKWFNRIAYDEQFWRTIDLTSKTYSNRVLLKFFRRFPRQCTEELKISGISTTRKAVSYLVKPPPFTEQLSSMIRLSYPNLRHLHISRYDFRDDPTAVKNITYLPPNLQTLYLKQCEMLMPVISGAAEFLQLPPCPLKNATENFSLQQLEILSLENSSCLGNLSFNNLPDLCPNLQELNLNGCYRLPRNQTFTNILLSYRRTLRRLYLRATQVDDDAIHCICRELKRLNILDIELCRFVTENIVENLLTLKQLTVLSADDGIRTLYEQRRKEEENVV